MSTFPGGLDAARRVLGERFGHSHLRVHQLRVLGPLLAGRSVLAVLPTIALAGSATPATRAAILSVLRLSGHRAETIVTSFDRPNLRFAVGRIRDDRERFRAMREAIRHGGDGGEGASVVYAPTRR